MIKYLIHQNCVDTVYKVGSITIENLIRIITANSEEEAIGKFVRDTEDLFKTMRKSNIVVYELEKIKTL